MIREYSQYQKNALTAVKDTLSHVRIGAVAGSGKTSTIVWICSQLPLSTRAVFCAFGKAIAKELETRLPKHVPAKTLHSLGFTACRKHLGNKVHMMEDLKTAEILKEFVDENSKTFVNLANMYKRIVSLAKNNLVMAPVSKETWESLINEYGVEIVEGFDLNTLNAVYNKATDKGFTKSMPMYYYGRPTKPMNLPVMDFDDMLYFPAKYGWNCAEGISLMCVDEDQDLNPAQTAMLDVAVKSGTRLVTVGDENQAIFGFRGANTKSIKELLERFSMKETPLSITYRCCKAVVTLAQRFVPAIEAAPNAPEGEILSQGQSEFLQNLGKLEHGDLVVCRTNAPLVSVAFALLKLNNGRKFRIQGKDIGEELGRLVTYLQLSNKVQDVDMEGFHAAVSKYESERIAHYSEMKNGQKYIEALQDKLAVIQMAAANCQSVSGIKIALKRLFADSDDRNCILLSTIHRAKGLEVLNRNNTCYFYRTDLCPHPRAKTETELQQENNLYYVAITRAKDRLVLVHGE